MPVPSMDWDELLFRGAGHLGWGLIGSYFPFLKCEREGTEHFEAIRRQGEHGTLRAGTV